MSLNHLLLLSQMYWDLEQTLNLKMKAYLVDGTASICWLNDGFDKL